jgi:hypothetical protein
MYSVCSVFMCVHSVCVCVCVCVYVCVCSVCAGPRRNQKVAIYNLDILAL